jgi:hypothetical protein
VGNQNIQKKIDSPPPDSIPIRDDGAVHGHILHHPELHHHDLQIAPSCIFCCRLDASFITRKETGLESSFLISDIILLGLYKFKKKC